MILIQTTVKQDCWNDENEWFVEKTNVKERKVLNNADAWTGKMTLGMHFFKDICERQQVVSDSPYEIHICYKSTCNQTKVLDFLATIGKSVFADAIKIQLMLKMGLAYRLVPISVVKINEITYRIVEKNE